MEVCMIFALGFALDMQRATDAGDLAAVAALACGEHSLARMALLTGTLAMTLRLTAQHLRVLYRSLRAAVAFGSVALGLHLIWSPT